MAGQPPRLDEATTVVVARPVGYGGAARPPSHLELPQVRHRDALLDLILVLLAGIILPYLPGLLTPVGLEDLDVPDVGIATIAQKWCEAAVAVGLLVYFLLRHRLRPASFGLQSGQLGRQALWGIGTFASVYVALAFTSVIALVLFLLFPAFENELDQRVEFVDAMPITSLPATLLLLVAVAVHEEVLFRGILLPYLRRVLGGWWSAGIISALVFAALHVPHQGLLGGLQVFSIAVVLTVFFILSRSLLAVTFAHLLFDFCQFQIARLAPDLQELLENFEG